MAQPSVLEGKKLIDLTGLTAFAGKIKETYTDKNYADATYATKNELDTLKDSIGVGNVTEIAESELADQKSGTVQKGDIVKQSDGSNQGHYLKYVGAGEPGADGNGYVDLGTSVDFADFATNTQLEEGLKKKADSTTVTQQLAGKANSSDLENYVRKEEDKGLSKNDYDDAAKAIVDGVAETYATKTEVTAMSETLSKVAGVKGSCTKEDLATKKEESNKGDIYVVTNDDNHLYMFLGADETGADENGFKDLGLHIDLDPYIMEEEVKIAEDGDLQAVYSALGVTA